MPDQEKVLKGLECCIDPLKARCPECPYYPCYDEDTTSEKLLADALALLKEQEPVRPYLDFDGRDVWRCGNCDQTLFHPTYTQCDDDDEKVYAYCSCCGRRVNWNA